MPRPRCPAAAPLFVLAPLLVLALTGCDAINSASDTLDKAEVCTKALSAAGYTPDLSNPAQSVQDAQQRAEELRELAEQTTDADLQRELRETADGLASLKETDVNPVGAAEWAADKLTQLEQLRQVCG